jgi:periplasmic divalent cation tolerance protein
MTLRQASRSLNVVRDRIVMIRIVMVTFPSADLASTISRAVIEERLAACVNLIPAVRSIFRWNDKISDETEVLAIFKTTAPAVTQLVQRVAQLHPYDVPEVIAVDVSDGLPAYLAWVGSVVG